MDVTTTERTSPALTITLFGGDYYRFQREDINNAIAIQYLGFVSLFPWLNTSISSRLKQLLLNAAIRQVSELLGAGPLPFKVHNPDWFPGLVKANSRYPPGTL